MSKLLYITHIIDGENDGGMARNKAFFKYFKEKNAKIFNLYDHNLFFRLFKVFSFLLHSLFFRNNKIFVHLGTIFNIFPKQLLRTKLGYSIFKLFLVFIAKRNNLYIEVNDLPYEQAKDLNLFQENFYFIFQKNIFDNTLKMNYVFASNEMEKYVLEKYSINKNSSQVIINGAPILEKDVSLVSLEKYSDYKSKYIYVGTLARGRGIEEIISVFNKTDSYLFLIGSGGEWLQELLNSITNIIYLGSFAEQEAMMITAQCDYGIMHYDSSKFYYNLCYPTKNSFYISAGINVISTKLIETQNVISKFNIFLFEDIENWKQVIENPNDYFSNLSKIDEHIKEKFYWEDLLMELKI